MQPRTGTKDRYKLQKRSTGVVFTWIFTLFSINRIIHNTFKQLYLFLHSPKQPIFSYRYLVFLGKVPLTWVRTVINFIIATVLLCKSLPIWLFDVFLLFLAWITLAVRKFINVSIDTVLKTTLKACYVISKDTLKVCASIAYIVWVQPLRFLLKISRYCLHVLQPAQPLFRLSFKTFFILFLFVILLSATIFYQTILRDLPSPNELQNRRQILSTKIIARDGTLLYKIYRNQNRTLIKLEDIPPHLINATIAAEDREYWSHPGFSLRGIMRAFQNNITDDAYTQGGSTITQQLVKNALLSSEKTFSRKLKEIILAIEVELAFSKHDILQMYFNEIPYGGLSYGVEEASLAYFGKSAKDLNLPEAALLAGISPSPTKYSPYGAYPELALVRQHYVLDRMQQDGYITAEENKEAKKAKITLQAPKSEILAPHFVMYVKDLLVEKYGTRMVEEGGLEVITSLDPQIQDVAEKAVKDEVTRLIPMHVTNGSALVTRPGTGEILAMVGSRDYFDTQHDGNVNVTIQLRQPGSSIKPLTYALALQSGFTPISTIDDAPIAYPDGDHYYVPVNYDGKFHGKVTLRTALASSFNIPAVKLLNQLGVSNLMGFAQTMGITTWKDRSNYGLSLTLGGGEVKMTELATAYGVFANQGMRVDLHPILRVQTADGKILEDFYCNSDFNLLPTVAAAEKTYCSPQSVLSPLIAYQISDILSDNNARAPAFGTNSLLYIPNHQVAVKTGTTNDKRDNWTLGYTPDYVVATWVGNNDNTPMSAVASGITGASPIWNTIMTSLLDADPASTAFNPPNGLIPVQVCGENGLLPCSSCANVRTEYFIPGTEPKTHCADNTPQSTEQPQTDLKNKQKQMEWPTNQFLFRR